MGINGLFQVIDSDGWAFSNSEGSIYFEINDALISGLNTIQLKEEITKNTFQISKETKRNVPF